MSAPVEVEELEAENIDVADGEEHGVADDEEDSVETAKVDAGIEATAALDERVAENLVVTDCAVLGVASGVADDVKAGVKCEVAADGVGVSVYGELRDIAHDPPDFDFDHSCWMR